MSSPFCIHGSEERPGSASWFISGPVSVLVGQQLCQMKCVGAGYGLYFISLSDSINLDLRAAYIAFTEAVTLFMAYPAIKFD